MHVINGRLRANTSFWGALPCCGVHARLSEKPNATKKCPLLQEVQDIPFTRHLRGIVLGVVVEEIEISYK